MSRGSAREIPFGCAQSRLSLRLKIGCCQNDAPWMEPIKLKAHYDLMPSRLPHVPSFRLT